MHRLRLPSLLGALACALVVPQVACAEQFVVQAGREWSSLGTKLKPGDEIILARGTHMPAAFTGLEGSTFAPIVIRSPAPDQLAEIAADREAIKLVDCRHVRIERIAVRSARRAGILIESTKPAGSLDIAINDVLVTGAKGLAEESGIVARGVKDLGIRRSRFENCAGCGILVEDCENLTVSEVQIASRTDLAPACGIRLTGRVWSAVVERVQMAGPIAVAFDLGRSESALHPSPPLPTDHKTSPSGQSPESPASNGKNAGGTDRPPSDALHNTMAEPLVRFLTLSNIRIAGVHRLFDAGSVADSTIRNVTHRDAKEEVYRVSVPPHGRPPVSLRMSECLVTWLPGALRRIGFVEEGADARGLVLGRNLWWSRELPAALPLLGPNESPFPGTVETPQILDVEPKFDARSRVINAEADDFGAED